MNETRDLLIFRELFLTSLDAVILVDCENGVVVQANPAAYRLLRYDEHGSLEGNQFSVLFPPGAHLTVAELLESIGGHDGVFTQRFQTSVGDDQSMDLTATMLTVGDDVLLNVTLRDARERTKVENERESLLSQLRAALAEVRTLSGLLPICASCKRIRDDDKNWVEIELFIQERSDAEFSHGLCPNCLKEYFPDYKEK